MSPLTSAIVPSSIFGFCTLKRSLINDHLEQLLANLFCFSHDNNNSDMADGSDDDFEFDEAAYQRNKERRDKVSSVMGEKMLQGFAMLGESCDACGVSLQHNYLD